VTLNIDKEILAQTSILYVEDDNEIREQMSSLLSKFINTIHQAPNGKEGLELYNEIKPDIVLTDIHMPKMDGLELSRHIKEIDPDTQIIVTTAFSDPSYLLKAIEIGVDSYILKPIDPKKVLEAISKYGKIVQDRKELKEYKDNLEKKVAEEIEKNKNKDDMLEKQSMQASMGEMINSIAHQWRQPLNAINVETTNIIVGLELGEDKTIIKQYSDNIVRLTKKMSKIITDFMEFNNPNRVDIEFSVKEILDTAKDILAPQMNKNSVKLEIIASEDIVIKTSEVAFKEVIVNLLNNAKDALVEHKEESDRNIKVYMNILDNDTLEVVVHDNAGGIPEDISEDIFKPYFTTKPKGIGTGIGLSIVKNLVEKELHGTIECQNSNSGAMFRIVLPTKRGE
jgi:YesN/AraC family two-component response regulator